MQRTFLYFAAFTGMGAVFAATLIVAARILDATEIGTWAFHCHVLTHAEGPNGMFGMVTALVVED